MAGAVGQLLERRPDLAGEEGGVRDPVQIGVLERARDRFFGDFHAPHGQRPRGERQPDRPDSAVEVVDRLAAGQRGVLGGDRVEPFRHRGVGLQERARADAEAEAAEHLLDRVVAPEERRRQVGDLRGRLVDRPVDRAHLGEAAQRLDELVETLRRFPEVRSIHWAVNETPAEVTNLPTTLLWGDDAIEEVLCGLRFRVRPSAFLQTNTAMAERLYAIAAEHAALTGGETIYDLYCGIGAIGLTLASRALTVWGVEVSEE